jgi:hypothetical protein
MSVPAHLPTGARPVTRRRHVRGELGAMYEINLLVWPIIYGVTGYAWGAGPGAVLGVVLGIVTAVPMIRASPYDVEILALPLLVPSVFLPRSIRAWYLLALCVLPWARLGLGLLRRRAPPKP